MAAPANARDGQFVWRTDPQFGLISSDIGAVIFDPARPHHGLNLNKKHNGTLVKFVSRKVVARGQESHIATEVWKIA